MFGNPLIFTDPDGRAPESPDWIYDQQEDGSYARREGVENDGGENFHTFFNNDGTTVYVNTKEKTCSTICRDDIVVPTSNPRKDGKPFITLEGHAKLTYGSVGANAEFLGGDIGAIAKFEGDLIGITLNSTDNKGIPLIGYTDASLDTNLDVGFEAGYGAGLGYRREFDRISGSFVDTDELEYAPGALPANAIFNTYTNEASLRVGGGVKAAVGVGIDVELFLMFNPKSK